MEKNVVVFRQDEVFENYLHDLLLPLGAVISTEKNGKNTEMTVDCGDEKTVDAVARALCSVKKFSVLTRFFPKAPDDVLGAAFMGALVGKEYETEVSEVRKRIRRTACINADGVLNFLLADRLRQWREMGTIASALHAQCLEEEDVKALVKYFMSGDALSKRTVVLDKGLYYDDDNSDIPLPRLYATDTENEVFTLLMLRPAGVIIPFPKGRSEKLIALIRFLGE